METGKLGDLLDVIAHASTTVGELRDKAGSAAALALRLDTLKESKKLVARAYKEAMDETNDRLNEAARHEVAEGAA